jgi:hypothetical protein
MGEDAVTSRISSYASDQALATFVLGRDEAEDDDPISFYVVDSEAQPSWFLRQRVDARLFVSPDYQGSQLRPVEAIGAAELLEVVTEALDQPPPGEHRTVALAVLSLNAVAVAVPDGLELTAHYPGGPLQPVVVAQGQERWALGPDHGPVGPPLRVLARNDHGRTRLTLELCWDLRCEHPAGRTQTRAALARVLARGRGWQTDQGALP